MSFSFAITDDNIVQLVYKVGNGGKLNLIGVHVHKPRCDLANQRADDQKTTNMNIHKDGHYGYMLGSLADYHLCMTMTQT